MGLFKVLEEKKKAKLRAEKAKKAKATVFGALSGAVAGILGGILFAPKSGKETRDQIAETSKKASEQVKEKVAEGKENIGVAKSRIQQYLADKKSAGTEVSATNEPAEIELPKTEESGQ